MLLLLFTFIVLFFNAKKFYVVLGIFQKLKDVRVLLRLMQSESGAKTGVRQKDVSLSETGKKEFIPTSYISFMSPMGIDLNTIFDDTLTISKRLEVKTEDKQVESDKEEIILLLRENNKLKDEKINRLQMDLGAGRILKKGTHLTKTEL
jgi:hypothetical protein